MPGILEETLSADETAMMQNDEASESETQAAIVAEKETAKEIAGKTTLPQNDQKDVVKTQELIGEKPADSEKPPEKDTMVPHGALHEEREKRRKADERATTLESRLDKILKLMGGEEKPPPAPKEIPDPAKDPLAALGVTIEEVKEIKKIIDNSRTQERNSQALQEVGNRAAREEREFLQTLPDYDAAIGNSPEYQAASAHLQSQRAAELRELGYGDYDVRDAQGNIVKLAINKVLMQDALTLARIAMAENKNPAATVMKLAKARGFVYRKPAQAAAAMTEADKIKTQAEGQRTMKSLSSAGGSAPAITVDGKAVANMSEKEFEKFLAKIEDDPVKMREVFGGD